MSHGKNADFTYSLHTLYKLYNQQYIVTVHKTTFQYKLYNQQYIVTVHKTIFQSIIYLHIHNQHIHTQHIHTQHIQTQQIYTQQVLALNDLVQGNTVITTMEHHWKF